MITKRQEKLLDFLIREYISTAEPISSKALQKVADLDVCGATIRNDLQELTKHGYIEQPHTSAGRIPTKKAYKYFAEKISCGTASAEAFGKSGREKEFSDFIVQQIRVTHQQIEQEMKLTEELMASLSETSITLSISHMPEKDDLFEILNILGSSKSVFGRDFDTINEIIKKLSQL